MTEHRVPTESELIELVRGIDVPAPQRLHDRVSELVDARTAKRGSGPPAWRARIWARPLQALTGAGAALAAAIVAVVIAAGGGAGHAPDLQTASALTLAPARSGAPAESATNRARLAA